MTECNKQMQQLELHPQSTIYYLSVIESSRTELQTVDHTLHESVTYADKLELDVIPVAFHQTTILYAKAQQ
jgi:hypothetical protein